MSPGNIDHDIAGGSGRHIPVMLNEVLDCLRPLSGKIIVDGTFGAGGYTNAFVKEGAAVIAVDRDPNAIRDGQSLVCEYPGQLKLVQGEFSELDQLTRDNGFFHADGTVLDIGVSSMQLDEGNRGFSFRQEGPLDMRMSQSGVSAADVVNQAAQKDLTRIIGLLGEEKKASLISREIVKHRETGAIKTTLELASLIEKVVYRKASDKIHPATRTFQALRIFVNRELEQLCGALFAAERLLTEGGRLILVTFHSLEDRIVKQFFRDRSETARASRHLPEVASVPATFQLKGSGLIKPTKHESEQNPRARSAKLRWGIRTSVSSRQEDYSIFGLPSLANLETFSTMEAR